MQDWIFLISIFLIGGFVTFLFFLINKQKIQKIKQLKMLSMLGFVRADRDLDLIIEIISGLNRKNDSSAIRVENIFLKNFPDGKIYLLDIIDRSDRSELGFGEMAVLLVSNEMNLPRFSIYPKLALKGRFGELTNTLLETIYSKIGNVMGEWGDERFEERYVVISDQEDDVRQILSTPVLERLNGIEGLAMECDRNYILVNQFEIRGKESKGKKTGYLIPTAMKIHDWLRE